MNHALKHQRDQAALEAYNVEDLSGLIRRIFPSIQSGLSTFSNMFKPAPAVCITAGQRSFLQVVEKRPYQSLMPLTAFVPEGLKKSYTEYSVALFPATDHARGATAVLDQYAVFLAMLISNRTAIFETVSRKKLYMEIATAREKLNKAVLDCFTNSSRTEVKVKDVVGRNADWPEVLKTADGMARMINEVDRSRLNKKVDECTELLARVSKLIGEGYFDKVAPEVVLDLSDGAYQVAAELEFYSVMHYRLDAYCKAIDRTLNHVIKVTSPE